MTPRSITNNYIQIRGGKFYWWRNPQYTQRKHRLLQVTANIMMYRVHLDMSRIQTHNVSDDRH